MEAAGTCYGASFSRESGPIRDVTARFTSYREDVGDQTEKALVSLQMTEWDVPNQTFGITIICAFTDKSIHCSNDCDGGDAILARSATGQLYFHSDNLRYDSVGGDATLLALNDADGRHMDGLFVMTERPGDSQCQAVGDDLFVTMQAGDISNRVVDIEQKLQRLGQFLEYPDVVFDDATRDAVTSFQRQYGLTTSGVVDQTTAALLANLMQSGAGGC
ncbi:MAG: hypothetical protein VR78_18650 [Hoeflea sp. BRH_c9]|nr:MAG: hypothetical protein VR78_18650 [Hoeflea sp. BRH_c9]